MNIGVFDSSLGGLAILKEILIKLPEYNYVYLGDNARVPYGGRSPEIIYEFTAKAVDFLASKQCSLIILACNTATAAALKKLQQEYVPRHHPTCKVLGVILPAVEAIKAGNAKKVGVIGTYTTIESKSFVREIHKVLPKAHVYQQACPLLVPIIEEGELEWEGLCLILEKYLRPFSKKKIDSLVLGCTHYGLIEKIIQKIIGPHVSLISEGSVVAQKLKEYLQLHVEIATKLSKTGRRSYYATDLNVRYEKLTKFFLGSEFRKTDRLQLVHI
ncbi:MAG: glutamate racemase [Patescibacteria group bacterium]|jgi:glutamate racemase